MLPRRQRLRSNQDFQRVYRGGRSWAHPLLALNVLPRADGRRVGISVSKKVGSAVRRNRVRRRLREIVRAELSGWKKGFDLVLAARAGCAGAPFGDLQAAVRELARRARLPEEPCGEPGAPYRLPEGGRPGTSSRGKAKGRGKMESGDSPERP